MNILTTLYVRHTRFGFFIGADGVLVNNGWAGAIGTVTNDVVVADGGATDGPVDEIGVGTSGTGCSMTSVFIKGEIVLRFIDGGGGASSVWCILYNEIGI